MPIPPRIQKYLEKGALFHRPGSPLFRILQDIQSFFGCSLTPVPQENPQITRREAFDALLFPEDHPAKSQKDNFYVTEDLLLRPHATCYQPQILRRQEALNLWACSAFRRDTIDRTHFPIFHQCDGVKLFDHSNEDLVLDDLRHSLDGLIGQILPGYTRRWDFSASFPFTKTSLEMEICPPGSNDYVEILGCGSIQKAILDANKRSGAGWAFGIGLERLAMLKFGIPDIRLFWTEDSRFHAQFENPDFQRFKPYSSYPPVYRDISFFALPDFDTLKVHEVCREFDEIEEVSQVDDDYFKGPHKSFLFRLTYRSFHQTLSQVQVSTMHDQVLRKLKTYDIDLR